MSLQSKLVTVLRGNLRRALRAARLDHAHDLLERLKQEDPLSVETRGLELEYLFAAKHYAEAKALAVQLVRLFPGSARICYLCGRTHYQDKDYTTAVRHFTESERLYPSWLTRRWLGKTFSQLGRLSEAEAVLLELVPDHAAVGLDLAWVYERMDDPERALEYLQRYLEERPEDSFALAQRLRLRARISSPEALTAEVETLVELDEEVPSEILTTYVQRLLETGQGEKARRAVAEYESHLDERGAASLAWICHHLRAFDLSMRLFLIGLPAHWNNVKYLSALESAAAHCGRIQELIEHYEAYSEQEKRLYGRIKRLEKRR